MAVLNEDYSRSVVSDIPEHQHSSGDSSEHNQDGSLSHGEDSSYVDATDEEG